jgi:ABC-2 type transport system permease protein
MTILVKAKFKQLVNTVQQSGKRKYLLFLLLGASILFLIGLFFIRIFGFLDKQNEFPLAFKLFISEKILVMIFLTLFLMLILSALISTLNIFFLSRDLKLLLASPLRIRSIFIWKALETAFTSASMVIFFALPVLYGYCKYFAPRWHDIIGVTVIFTLYILCGVLSGILLGMIIPSFFSAKRLQPVLSLVSIGLISLIVIFLRLLRPEQLLKPESIDNLFEYMSGLKMGFFSYFPFSWLAKGIGFISRGNQSGILIVVGLFLALLIMLSVMLYFFQKRFYLKLIDRLNESSLGSVRSGWKKKFLTGDFSALWKKEIKTFMRTPSQWSQLLIIAAMVMVFILNMKSIPLPHPAVKNIIVYLNLGMAAFIVAGLNSRFTFTAISLEGPGIVHVLAAPFSRKRFLQFKLLFFAIPQIVIGFALFYTGDISLKIDPFIRVAAVFFLIPLLFLLSVMAVFFGLQIDRSIPISPQHLIVSKPGIYYMLWSLLFIVGGMAYFVRPLFLFYFNLFQMRPIPYSEIFIWFFGFVILNLLIGSWLYTKSQRRWAQREFL